MINLKSLLLFLVISVLITNCSSKKGYYTPESLIKANAEFMNDKNLEGVMSTIHPESPNYPAVETMAKTIFDRYDLKYTIESIKVLEENDNEAKVEFTQLTKKIKGPEFKDNRTTGIHTLKKDGDSWKIYSTEMTKLTLLDKNETGS
ncbi:MAG TPA: hypothetical protein PKD67_03510 [Ignavibacteriaceae bacterium]|nr:hypothetical protein [Ignavibacteriaceae bacterium]